MLHQGWIYLLGLHKGGVIEAGEKNWQYSGSQEGLFRAVKALAFFLPGRYCRQRKGLYVPLSATGRDLSLCERERYWWEREMAAYLPIGVVINMRGNNQPFVWGGGNSQQPCWTNEYVQSGYAHLCWGRKRKQLQSKCKAHMVVLFSVLFMVHSAFWVLCRQLRWSTARLHQTNNLPKNGCKMILLIQWVVMFFLTQSYSTGRLGDTAICHLAQH